MWERRIFYKKYSSFRSIQQQIKDVNLDRNPADVVLVFAGRVSRLFLDFSADDVILCALFWNTRPPKASFGGVLQKLQKY